MKKLVIFGSGDIAELAHYYFTTDSVYEVVAFTIDAKYRTETTFCDLPVIDFENISNHYTPEQCEIFVALSYSKLNAVRKEKYLAAKALLWGEFTHRVSILDLLFNCGKDTPKYMRYIG